MTLHKKLPALISLGLGLTLPGSSFAAAAPDLAARLQPAIDHGLLHAVSAATLSASGVKVAHLGRLMPGAEVGRAPDDHTLYEIGSITKVFTALLLADAVVRGEVTLDTPIAALLPADVVLPEGAGGKITLGMLATHTSGLPRIPREIPPDDYRDPYASYGEAELGATLRRVRLEAEPGTVAAYSNLGAGLLGALLARRAGMSYEELLAARVTGPLGMHETQLTVRGDDLERFAPAFTETGAPFSHWGFAALAGAGGLRSTSSDMVRFARVMLDPRGTALEQAVELVWRKHAEAPTISPGGIGLGWLIAGDGETRWHNGMTGGFHAALFLNRKLAAGSLVLTNRSTPLGTQLAEQLLRDAAGMPERPVPHANRPVMELSAEQLDRCVGTFRLSPQFVLVFERRNGSLFVTPTGQGTDRLYAAAEGVFFSRLVPAEIHFEPPDGSGPATGLVLRQGGRELRGLRELLPRQAPAQER